MYRFLQGFTLCESGEGKNGQFHIVNPVSNRRWTNEDPLRFGNGIRSNCCQPCRI